MNKSLIVTIQHKKTGLRISDNSNISGMHSNRKYTKIYRSVPTKGLNEFSYFYWDDIVQQFNITPL